MLSLLSNLVILSSGLIALATLVSSWRAYRPCWQALAAEMEQGVPVNLVSVTIRETSIPAFAPAPAFSATPIFKSEIIYPARFSVKTVGAVKLPAASPVLHAAA